MTSKRNQGKSEWPTFVQGQYKVLTSNSETSKKIMQSNQAERSTH